MNYGVKESKENIINEAKFELGDYISKHLLSSFLFSYGV